MEVVRNIRNVVYYERKRGHKKVAYEADKYASKVLQSDFILWVMLVLAHNER